MSSKVCNKCMEVKSLSEFHKHKGRKLGVTELCKVCRNNLIVERRHGLGDGELLQMKKERGYTCEICGEGDEDTVKGLCVDHDHTNGEVRGLLCGNCNNGLGRFKDSIENLGKAIEYLKSKNNK